MLTPRSIPRPAPAAVEPVPVLAGLDLASLWPAALVLAGAGLLLAFRHRS